MLSSLVSVIPRTTEMFVLNASVLNSSTLESKLFTFRCPKYMPLFLHTFHVSLKDGIEGRLSSNKDNSVSPLSSIQKEKLWNGKFSHFHNHYIYHYQKKNKKHARSHLVLLDRT